MSWWDASGFTNLASQAIKNAQKKIDKVLDIDEDPAGKRKGSSSSASSKPVKENEGKSKEEGQEGDFWSGWLGAGGKKAKDEEEETPSGSQSSWNLPWSKSFHASEQAEESSSGSKEMDAGSTASGLPSLNKKAETSTLAKPATQLTDSKPKEDISHVTSSTKASHTVEERDISGSDSFTSNWQDFSMEGPFEISAKTTKKEITKDKKDDVISTEDEVEHIHSQDGAKAVKEETSDMSGTDVKHEQYIPEQDISTEPAGDSTHNASAEDRLSTAQHEDAEIQQEAQTVSAENEQIGQGDSAVEKLFKDEPNLLSAQQDQSLLKTSTSSSFTALSDDSVTESFLSTSLQSEDVGPKEVSTPQKDIQQDTETSKNESSADLGDTLDLSTKGDSGIESSNLPSDISLVNITHDSSGSESAKESSALKEADVATRESQKSQVDFMQEYVNVSAISGGSQTVSYDGSAISSDDLLHTSSSTEVEMGNSRTSSDLDLPGGRASSTGSSDTSKFDSSIDTVVDRSGLDSQSDVDILDKEPPYSLFGESQHGEDDMGASAMSESGLQSDDSYVKCMIEEAMEDLSKTEDSGSDNHSSGEKSESSKVDSEMEKSIYSGHESSDEIETTTSSDIEIISAPTPNGDNKYHTPFDLSPLKMALQRTIRDQGHQRSDSQSSSSAHSKAGEMDHMSPERGEGASWRDDDYPHHDLHVVREEGPDNPYHPEKLLKLAQDVVEQQLQGGQKLAEMAEVLQARESKLIQLSKDNHQLMEDNNILRNQLQQSEEARETETADLTALTEEFTARLGESEKKMQAVLKEKETLKQKLASAEKELERRSGDSNLEAMLEEKRVQVEELLQEGEKLSKQQLQSSNIIKKLRVKEKESDATITTQKKKLDEQAKELERLTTVLDSKEDMEKKQAEAINQLNAAVQRQEKELTRLKSELEDAQEKSRGLQAALDNSYKEIAELHRSNATQDSKAQEAALSAEAHVREELKAAMEREQQRFRQEREAFIMQADDLRLDMTRLEKEHSRREDLLRQEIAHLQERQQQDEARSQDLTHSVTSATRPLLRQIENLQATFGAQSNAWERVEKNLTDRLAEAQTALAMAQEKERTANERHMELSVRVTSLEATNSRLKQEKAQLSAEMESDKSKLEELQDARNNSVAQLETSKQKLSQELTQLKMDKVHLESQLNVERTRLENEKKKTVALEEQLRLAVSHERPRSRGTPSPSPSMSISRQESLMGSVHEGMPPGMMNWSFHEDADSSSMMGAPKTSVYDSLRQSGAAIVVENLSSQLKLREGEISHMQSEIGQLERTRESMARELVNLTNQNDELQETKKAYENLQEQYSELNKNYSAILQMYGEKEEQVQELRLDLQDVKEMYKSQIDALLAK